jgi:hypothetical protein
VRSLRCLAWSSSPPSSMRPALWAKACVMPIYSRMLWGSYYGFAVPFTSFPFHSRCEMHYVKSVTSIFCTSKPFPKIVFSYMQIDFNICLIKWRRESSVVGFVDLILVVSYTAPNSVSVWYQFCILSGVISSWQHHDAQVCLSSWNKISEVLKF